MNCNLMNGSIGDEVGCEVCRKHLVTEVGGDRLPLYCLAEIARMHLKNHPHAMNLTLMWSRPCKEEEDGE